MKWDRTLFTLRETVKDKQQVVSLQLVDLFILLQLSPQVVIQERLFITYSHILRHTVGNLSRACWWLNVWFSGHQVAVVTFRPVQWRSERSAQDCGCWPGGGWLLSHFFKLISYLSSADWEICINYNRSLQRLRQALVCVYYLLMQNHKTAFPLVVKVISYRKCSSVAAAERPDHRF